MLDPRTTMKPTRRQVFAGLSALAVAPLLAACGDDGKAEAADTPSSGSGASEESAFPVTITHKYGETTLEKAPTRVVCVGLTEQDALLALGIVPVAVTKWFGDAPGLHLLVGDRQARRRRAARGARGHQRRAGREDRGARTGPDHRAVLRADREGLRAALEDRPDRRAVRRLRRLRRALGRDGADHRHRPSASRTQMQEIVDDVKQQIADAAAAHPEFEGKQAMVVTPYEGLFVYGPEDPRSRMLVDLGFEFPTELFGERRRGVRHVAERRAHRRPRPDRRRRVARPRVRRRR